MRLPGALIIVLSGWMLAGCNMGGVTFPADTVSLSIERIARSDYKLDAIARVSGKTVGVMAYSESLIDEARGSLSEEASEKLGNLMVALTRVALSTDKELEFLVVVLRDRTQPHELMITRYLTDIRMLNQEAIPYSEMMNRIIWQNSKYRQDPVNPDHFALKEMTLERFLAQQIVQRLRAPDLGSDKNDDEKESVETQTFPNRLADGRYRVTGDKREFDFTVIAFEDDESEKHVMDVFEIVRKVFRDYRFRNFDRVTIVNPLGAMKLVFGPELLDRLEKKEITGSDVARMIEPLPKNERLKVEEISQPLALPAPSE